MGGISALLARAGGRWRISRLTACGLAATSIAAALLWASGQPASAAGPGPVRFSLAPGGRPIPPSFLGLSIEFKELSQFEAEGTLFDRVLALIKPEDGTRMALRIGGKSADHVYWQTAGAKPPEWVSVIGTTWLTNLSDLVRRNRLRVMLDLNLAVHAPSLEASFAVAANRALPRGSLVGLEIGNEPDLYAGQPQLEKQRVPGTDVGPRWAVNYSPSDYRRDYTAYARALVSRLPHVALGGPEIISASPPWLATVENLGRLSPAYLTVHRYPGSTCFREKSPLYPTLATLLSEGASSGLAASVKNAITLARAHRQELLLDEVNSISCGGNVGVANTFATALWAPDALFEMIRAGVNGVNWEFRPGAINSPFIAEPNSIKAMPELYGLAAFSQMTHPGAVVLNSKLSESPGQHVKVWAVRFGGAIRLLILNKGAAAADVTLKLGMDGHAFLKRLSAPRLGASSGITFGGQTIGADGRWHGRPRSPSVPGHDGDYTVTVPGFNAAMLTVWP